MRQKRNSMTISVFRCVTSPIDIEDFLKTTDKFGKRFFKANIKYDMKQTQSLKIQAIGISRELVYKISWEMEIYPYEDIPDSLPKNLPRGYHEGTIPDSIPKTSAPCGVLCRSKESCNYVDVFHYNGFIEIDELGEI